MSRVGKCACRIRRTEPFNGSNEDDSCAAVMLLSPLSVPHGKAISTEITIDDFQLVKTTFRLCSLLFSALLLVGNTAAQPLPPPGLDQRPANVISPPPGQSLTAPSAAAAQNVVDGYLRGRGASARTAASLRQTSESRPGANGIRHVRLEQQVNGLTVVGAYVKAALNQQGELVHLIEKVVPVPAEAPEPAVIDELQALMAALAVVHPGERLEVRPEGVRNGNTTRFAGDAFFYSAPTVTQVAIPQPNSSLEVGYLVQTWSKQRNLLHHTVVDGLGQVVSVELRTANDSYNVFVEAPGKGTQTVVAGPGAGNVESPSGWLGAGTQTTINISGNNVKAYLDVNANNAADTGGTAVVDGNFLTAADLTVAPTATANRAVAVQNLFYLNNRVHDILYRHGFDEAAGNFQLNNFSAGGAGADPVNAEAQDGSGTDNANFSTPLDGSSPRMQMYLWSGLGTHEVVVGATKYAAMGAQFGPALTTTGISGTAVPAYDGGVSTTDGCETISTSVGGKIALIDRGTCNFIVKVLNAQSAGATAVIVVNNDDSAIFTMGGSERRIKIPSVMISKADGAALRLAAGSPGISVTLRKKSAAPLQLDGDLDSDIVFHEYGHGLTWRMIGGMSGPLAGAIGEGASDTLAFLINGDDVVGEYASSNPIGIRRYPYAGYPLTYKSVTGASVHNDGEIYAAIMWHLKELFESSSLNLTADDVLAYFVDGMNYTPSTPAFENMRNGMLQAAGADDAVKCAIWKAFAKYGVGVGASGKVKGGRVTITESMALPKECTP
jgi:extracellular elastinolytic metalloproteinase